jgi:hypothetical protein
LTRFVFVIQAPPPLFCHSSGLLRNNPRFSYVARP